MFSASATPAAVARVGTNYPVNQGAVDPADINGHNSPTLVANPANRDNLAVANRIDTPAFSCALHLSLDGGSNWTQTPLPVPTGEEPKCYAPDAAFGPDGRLYVSFVTLQGDGNVPNAVWLVTSADGGRTLSKPTRALGALAFQVRLAADPESPGRIYLSWLQAAATATLAFPETGYPVNVALSGDGGATWDPPVRVSETARSRVVAPSLVAGAKGELYVSYLDLGDDRLDYEGGHEGRGGDPYPGPWMLVLARSKDAGATWRTTVVEPRLTPPERFIVFVPPFPSLAVDRRADRVFVAFADARLGDRDAYVWASEDDGATFGPARRVNDSRRSDGTSQYLPKVSVAPGGRLDVVYYDRRADADDLMNDVSLQSSFDGGATFTERLRLTTRSFDSRIGFGSERGLAELGSRIGLLSTERRALAVWSDTRAGTDASRKQDLVRAVVDVTEPSGVSDPFGPWLRYGGLAVVALGLVVLLSWIVGRRP